MIKAVLFDLDGTLIDTNNLIIKSFQYTLKKHLDICPTNETISMHFGEPLFTTLARYDKNKVDTLLKTYLDFNAEKHDELTKDIKGAKEAIIELKEMGIKVAIVTSKRRIIAERGLNLFGLQALMDAIITPEDTKEHKPHGEPVLKACEILDITPEETIMVGDSHFDILCGQDAGARTCLVKYTALPLKEVLKYNPDYAIDSIFQIKNIIEKEELKAKA